MLGHGHGTVEHGGIGWICLVRIIGGKAKHGRIGGKTRKETDMVQGSGLLPPDPDPDEERDWLEANTSILPDDEYIPDLQCSRKDEHEDHYWRQTVYCSGRSES